ncbi:A/G-specific DNA-adenine glycosylase [Nitrosomonas eutropha]|uniref:A/G-specific adenine glycosylase n=1 Tax=Nitrosomonas TaxID=914 RepID=UPI000897D654|nr:MULTISPECIES: A/G-specific adenine glycosylase [Nitrosomonas]MXS79476.1 A/G-specific adenine glycosylase [Nitrosomonas sp. GH22]SDW88776.1 A/G-specific DNA-adenine glycosylase [Nitrosomonas eutropha]
MIQQATRRPRTSAVESDFFAGRLIRWQLVYGRHSLPWQGISDPYAIWISEIMLQQTQVSTVIPYYERFMTVFPNIAPLASAPVEEVLTLWSGLGYYSRGRNLHRTARMIMEQYGGAFPQDIATLQRLPGIGRSTAAAIAAFAFGKRCTILDGNVKRILIRYFGVNGHPGERMIEEQLWQLAEDLLPVEEDHKTIASYTQALMDLGALVCVRTQPRCEHCPLQADCYAYQNDLTAVLPVPKPRKTPPIKEIVHLILLNQGRILLKKRPASGIWGGLWCFPETSINEDSVDYCKKNLHLQVLKFAELPHLQHTFTHFKLIIQPQLLQSIMYLPEYEENSEENDFLWMTIEEALQRAIPVPVRKLLLMTQPLLQSCHE